MNGVNELFQNIRFLKFYGWGMFQTSITVVRRVEFFPDSRWAHKVNEQREFELGWRVKEAIVGL